MKRKDFLIAQQSLKRSREIVESMSQATNAAHMEELWSDFLISSQRVFSKLAAASTGKSAGWFGKIKKERSEDPLLIYVHQTRHADEHGLEKVASSVGGKLEIKGDGTGKPTLIKEVIVGKKGAVESVITENAIVDFRPADAILHPVKNRGVIYEPPKEHLGKPWTENNAQAVARATIAYMDKIIAEGETLTTN